MTSLLEDKDQIRELMANYCFYSDSGQAENYVNLFTEDCELDLGPHGQYRGKPALLELQRQKGGKSTPIRHHTTNIVIEINGDAAHVKSYVLVLNLQNGTPAIIMSGHYFDRLTKQDGQWRFRRRAVKPDPVDDGAND